MLLESEQWQAGLEPCYRDWYAVTLLPSCAREAQSPRRGHLPVLRQALNSVRFVSELFRDPQRRGVIVKGSRCRLGCAEPGEGEVQASGTHLSAEPSALVPQAKPRKAADLPQDPIVASRDLLHPHNLAVSEDSQVE